MNTFNIPHELEAKFLADGRNRRLATEENVKIAIDLISKAGVRPSIRNVQHLLGGGSTRDVSKWLSANKPIEAERNLGRPVAPKIALDESIINAIERQISTSSASAAASAEQKVAQLTEMNEALSEDLISAEILVENLRDDIATSNALIQQQIGQLAERTVEVAKMQESTTESLKAAELKLERERCSAEDLRQQVVQLRLEAATLPTLQLQITSLSEQLRNVSILLSKSEQVAAVALAEKAAESDRADECGIRELNALERVWMLENQLSDARRLDHDLVDAVRVADKKLAIALTRIEMLETTHKLPTHVDIDVTEGKELSL